MVFPSRALVLSLLPMVALGAACSPDDADEVIPDLPDEETDLPTDDPDDFDWPVDTDSPPPEGEDPDHWLYAYQDGTWSVGPTGGPYTALSGELLVYEFVDWQLPTEDEDDTDADTDPVDTDTDLPPWEQLEENPLHCLVRYQITGEPSESTCPECDVGFDVTFTVVEGDPGPCYDPELPRSGDTLRFGWRWDTPVVLHDLANIDLWYPWFAADLTSEQILVSYTDARAISLEEEEEEDE